MLKHARGFKFRLAFRLVAMIGLVCLCASSVMLNDLSWKNWFSTRQFNR